MHSVPDTGSNSRASCCRTEVREHFRLASSVMTSYILGSCLSFGTLVFAGRVGKTELAASVLAFAFIRTTGLFIGEGLAMSVEVLGSRAYSVAHVQLAGIWFQRGVWISVLACVFAWAVWVNTDSILLLVFQQHDLVR